ncbi:MAG: A/G-specific adenine glycosylase [Acidobacteriota bacterium]|nr:A/G-specific adenine glycosylase [Acidobacteriota bacterium]
MSESEKFAPSLLAWYDGAKRDLPWRRTQDPYAVLVSELMLQQTQVKTVIPYYLRFLEQFPTPQTLAEADEETVLKAWEGLGYYRRVRHLKEAARQISQDHGGVFPGDMTGISNLKGVGAYTSAAVGSIAFGLPFACVDGNVIRVVTRLRGIDDDVSSAKTKNLIQSLADDMLDKQRPGDFNQAMMELGATVCTPREPSCLSCTVNRFCATWLEGSDPRNRPVKSKKVRVSRVDFETLFLYSDDRFLLCRRPDEGLLAGMWELPAQIQPNSKPWLYLLHDSVTIEAKLPKPFTHRFTHLHARYFVTVCRAPQAVDWLQPPSAYVESRWFRLDELTSVPLTKVLRKKLPQLRDYLGKEPPCPSSPSTLPGM